MDLIRPRKRIVGLPHNTLHSQHTMAYFIPDRTCLRSPLKKDSTEQKTTEWPQVQGVPCKMIKEEADAVILHSFLSDVDKNFRVPLAEFREQFAPAEMDGEYILTQAYPSGRIHVSEFEKRKEASKFLAAAMKVVDSKSLQDKLKQTFLPQGCTHTSKMDEYLKFKSGEKELKTTENFGDPIFNRTKRWAPPISSEYTHDDFKKTKGFPAPLGIRTKDFCLPSGVLAGAIELVTQMARFENPDPKLRAFLDEKKIEISEGVHCCKWCGKSVDATKCTSAYKSATNYIELCHRDPNGMFTRENVYWGHGDCNRRQGGYTELDRADDVAGLANQDPEVVLARLFAKLGPSALAVARKLLQ